jgi:hypothetical protein
LQEFNIVTGFVVLGAKVLCVGQFLSDEAWFHMSGYVNSQNNRLWSAKIPYAVHKTSLHSLKIGVRCAVFRRWILEQLFFEETINLDRYQNLLTQFISLLE